VRAHFLLALSVLGSSSLVWGASLAGVPPVRASLDDDAVSAPVPAPPRMIRKSLDDTFDSSAVSVAAFPAHDAPQVLPPPPRRVFRISLDHDQPALDGRLIRLSLEDGRGIYGRLNDSLSQGRHLRTSLD
jgi:hypothetical protein